MIKELWDKTVESDLDNLNNSEKRVIFDWPLNAIAKILNWRKRFYKNGGLNIIGNKTVLPFKFCEEIYEGKKCMVFDYGIMKDYVRKLPNNKEWIGFLLNHKNEIILWFKLTDMKTK